MILYDIVRGENNEPKLLPLEHYSLIDPLFDAYTGADIMLEEFHMGEMENEHLYYLTTDEEGTITSAIMSSIGTPGRVEVSKRTLLIFLVLTGAKGFAMYHNHPNNDMRASQDDIFSDFLMQGISNMLEVDYLGSFIIGQRCYLRVGDKEATKVW